MRERANKHKLERERERYPCAFPPWEASRLLEPWLVVVAAAAVAALDVLLLVESALLVARPWLQLQALLMCRWWRQTM